MPRAYCRASTPGHSRDRLIVLLAALIALMALAFCSAALGAEEAGSSRVSQGVLLGDTTVESHQDALLAGRLEAFRLRAHASGRAAKLQLYLDTRNGATRIVVGLYRNNRGRPGALLATGSIGATRSGAWNLLALDPKSRLVRGRSYWLSLLGEGGTLRYRARSHGRCQSNASTRANLSALPSAWSAGRALRHAHCPISAYATVASFSSPLSSSSPSSPGGSGAPVNLTPPTISVAPAGVGSLLQPVAPFAPPVEQIPGKEKPPVEETPHEETPPVVKGKAPVEETPQEETPPVEETPGKKTPPPVKPINSAVPAIGGALTVGDVLSSTKGTWSGSPTSYAYHWQDCDSGGKSCTNISGATATTYTLKSSDVGHTLRITVTATNTAGSTTATSPATAVVMAASSPPPPPPSAPTNTTLPTISGATIQGQALAVTNGSWSGNPSSYTYQWQDCNSAGESCSSIGGATTANYTLAAGDVGHRLRAVVTAKNEGGSTSASSQATASVVAYTSGPAYPACTQTISQGANVASALSGATAGSVICLNSGAYGNLTLNSTHSADVTLQAAPEAHVTTGKVELTGSHIVVRGLWIDGEVALEEGSSYITIDRDDITGGGEGIVFDTSDCTVPNAPTWAGCEPHAPISNVTISSNHIHNIGEAGSEDAIHLDNWRNVTVTGNEFDHILESGNHTDCLQSVYGGEGLTFDHNYEHDNDCQGIFIKDGDATNVSFTDNLFLRDQMGSYANFAQVWNVKGLTIQQNTIWDGKGFALVADGASFTPTATIDHNVLNIFKVSQPIGTPFSITESNDIFGESPTNMSEGSGDSVVGSPGFANTATDDYRLASNPKGIGVDWAPAEERYGPAG